MSLDFKSVNGRLYLDNKVFHLKGTNWAGFQKDGAPHGLWQVSMDSLFNFMATNKFNALRVPLSADMALNLGGFPKHETIDYNLNLNLVGKRVGNILDTVVEEASKRGIIIMLDMHTLHYDDVITDLWYDGVITEEKYIEAWLNLVNRYKSKWNVVAVDLKNEPKGAATWGTGSATDWRLAAERIGNAILAVNPKLLIFVEGHGNNVTDTTPEGDWDGGNLSGVATAPVRLAVANKLVYSPHVYGPDVYNQAYFNAVGFPNNMPDIWNRQWAYIKQQKGAAIVIGEWGGKYLTGSKDAIWHDKFADFLIANDLRDNFYWALNDNSGDTKGLVLADWTTGDQRKLALLDRVQPNPSKFIVVDGKITIDGIPETPTDPDPVPEDPVPPSGFTPAMSKEEFLRLYGILKNPTSAYFDEDGIPYHTRRGEEFLVEAPDHGLLTTSEGYSYYIGNEVMYGAVTGDWSGLKTAWESMEKWMIPEPSEQPTVADYNPAKPASYAPEWEVPEKYPSQLDLNAPVGVDPIANELKAKHGAPVYGMHWLLDTDNVYGFGGLDNKKAVFINTFQRGPQESVWETVPHPSIEEFKYGGPNGFLDLFVKDSSYTRQWRYTNAPDADARVVQFIYLAKKIADLQGGSSIVDAIVAKASKMGDWLRYAMADKYFEKIGAQGKVAGTGKDSFHYLMSWYYAWGGPIVPNNWNFRIGSSHCHFGYQNPLAAWALSTKDDFKKNLATTGAADWQASLLRQIQFYYWLQSAEGAIAGGATNSYNGRYEQYPSGLPTFFGMVYDEAPVYRDPPSNTWFGFQTWSMERVIQYYLESKDSRVLDLITKWVNWVNANIKWDESPLLIPSNISWSGAPNASFSGTGLPAANSNLHVEVIQHGQDVGLMGSVARCFIYFAKATNNNTFLNAGLRILTDLLLLKDELGFGVDETRDDYKRINDKVYIPPGWTGKMPNGDIIDSNSTFSSIRSFYKGNPVYEEVKVAIAAGETPIVRYHRFWAESEILITFAMYYLLYTNDDLPPIDGDNPGEEDPDPIPEEPSGELRYNVVKNGTGWSDANYKYQQYDVTVINASSVTIQSAKIQITGVDVHQGPWSMVPVDASQKIYGFPSWIYQPPHNPGLGPQASFTDGFIAKVPISSTAEPVLKTLEIVKAA